MPKSKHTNGVNHEVNLNPPMNMDGMQLPHGYMEYGILLTHENPSVDK